MVFFMVRAEHMTSNFIWSPTKCLYFNRISMIMLQFTSQKMENRNRFTGRLHFKLFFTCIWFITSNITLIVETKTIGEHKHICPEAKVKKMPYILEFIWIDLFRWAILIEHNNSCLKQTFSPKESISSMRTYFFNAIYAR